MRNALRQSVRSRDDFRCRYCGVTETDVDSELTLDHFQPRANGGNDDIDNLLYCCHPCNEFKHDYWQTVANLRLLHPLYDTQTEHFREQDDGMLFPLTERGGNHLRVLHLNRPELIAHRIRNRFYETREVQHRATEERFARIEEELRDLRRQIAKEFGDTED